MWSDLVQLFSFLKRLIWKVSHTLKTVLCTSNINEIPLSNHCTKEVKEGSCCSVHRFSFAACKQGTLPWVYFLSRFCHSWQFSCVIFQCCREIQWMVVSFGDSPWFNWGRMHPVHKLLVLVVNSHEPSLQLFFYIWPNQSFTMIPWLAVSPPIVRMFSVRPCGFALGTAATSHPQQTA